MYQSNILFDIFWRGKKKYWEIGKSYKIWEIIYLTNLDWLIYVINLENIKQWDFNILFSVPINILLICDKIWNYYLILKFKYKLF